MTGRSSSCRLSSLFYFFYYSSCQYKVETEHSVIPSRSFRVLLLFSSGVFHAVGPISGWMQLLPFRNDSYSLDFLKDVLITIIMLWFFREKLVDMHIVHNLIKLAGPEHFSCGLPCLYSIKIRNGWKQVLSFRGSTLPGRFSSAWCLRRFLWYNSLHEKLI